MWGAEHSQAQVARSKQDFSVSGFQYAESTFVFFRVYEKLKNSSRSSKHGPLNVELSTFVLVVERNTHWHCGFSWPSVSSTGKGDFGEQSELTRTVPSRMVASSGLRTGIIVYLEVSGYT